MTKNSESSKSGTSIAGILTFDDIEDRRRQSFHLKTRGHTYQEIADSFGVHRDTVRSDLRQYKGQLKEAQGKLDRDEYVAEVRADFEQMRAELWKDYQKTKKPGERTRVMGLIAKLRDQETKLLHDCDLLEKAPQRIEHTHSVQGVVSHLHVNLSETTLEAIETLIMAQHMNLSPERLLALRGRPPEYIDVPNKKSQPLPQEKARVKPLPVPKNSTVEHVIEGDEI